MKSLLSVWSYNLEAVCVPYMTTGYFGVFKFFILNTWTNWCFIPQLWLSKVPTNSCAGVHTYIKPSLGKFSPHTCYFSTWNVSVSHQAEETEATQAVPVREGREWAEPGNHLLSRHTKREEDGPTEDSIKATCRLRWDPGAYSEDCKSLQIP